MKRKLIKRNKKFLSSRFEGYLIGYGSFQPMVSFTFNEDNTISNRRTHWMWFYNEKFFEALAPVGSWECGPTEELNDQ